jgi:hypothetical protein
MIPGFIINYIDNDKFKHLYFFPGIDDKGESIYNNIDLSNYALRYDKLINKDNSIDYKFYDKHIRKIICKLVTQNNETITEELIF